jgi:hypothetical protein
MSFDSSRLILIVGHYKSGSTWLLNMLSLHPAVRGVQETHLFHHLRHAPDLRQCTRTLYTSVPWSGGGLGHLPRHFLVQRFGRFLGRGRPFLSLPLGDRPMTRLDLPLRSQLVLRRQLDSSSSAREYCCRFFSFLWSQLQPERYLLEKTPSNVRYMGDIVQALPQARLVAIHRDGRDVVVSDRSFRQCYKRAAAGSLRESILRWRADMEAALRARQDADLYVLSYEELVRAERETLRKLLDHLHLNASGAVLGDMIERSSFEFRSGRQRGQEDARSFLRKGIIGDWRDRLAPEEQALFKEIAGDLLIRLGYETSHDW